MTIDEFTPLVGAKPSGSARLFSPASRILLAGFIISIALSFTQVPILYAFRIMQCDDFYNHHPPASSADRCSRTEIDAGTATQVSILGITTTLCGVINLFVAGWQIRAWGPKAALVLQTFFPAIRVATQVLAVKIGARTGILIIKSTQLVGILGGPAGYLLVLNTAASEVVQLAERTAVFGSLQGSVMLGTAIGYLFGGLVGDTFGIVRPFEAAFLLFMASSLYALTMIPYIPPSSFLDTNQSKASRFGSILGPLRILTPQMFVSCDGGIINNYGVLFLGLGIFMGVLATGYTPILIQMYATAAFNFHPTENGYLMSINSLIRGIFLMFYFPRIIGWGRKRYSTIDKSPMSLGHREDQQEFLAANTEDVNSVQDVLSEQGLTASQRVENIPGRDFDLTFLKWSLILDGAVTAYTAFATQGWHIYLAGFLLPLASGSAPAAKGVVTEMCSPEKRADALQAMTLIENIAMLSTLGLFGAVFSIFSHMGKPYLTFYCNAAVALIAVLVLMFSRFPPQGSRPN